jgi:hypothetical protein
MPIRSAGLCLAVAVWAASLHAQTPAGTAFTYQGRLTDGGGSPTGPFDIRFTLFDAPTGGDAMGSPVVRQDVPVGNGLFTVPLDFGAAFAGQARWMEVAVRPGASTGAFTVLSPRQELTPTPNALFTQRAPWTGLAGVPGGFADGVDNDSGGDITGVNAGSGLTGGAAAGEATLVVNTAAIQSRVGGSCPPGQAIRTVNQDGTVACEPDDDTVGWGLGGNVGTNPATQFIGTTDGQPLELRVNGLRALRVEPATSGSTGSAPNMVGGHPGNAVGAGVAGATIAGGGADLSPAHYNRVDAPAGTIAGGYGNTVTGFLGFVGGGNGNVASGQQSVVAGGGNGTAGGAGATVSGGSNNGADANFATVGGGLGNTASGAIATVPGGYLNVAGGWFSLAAGRRAKVRSAAEVGGGDPEGDEGTWVWADAADADFSSTGPNQFLIRAAAGVGVNANDPGFPLDVNGVVRSRAGGFRFPDDTTQATAAVNPAADITAVSAGAGLTGGGTSGAVSLGVSFAGTGGAATVARSDHDHGGAYIRNTTATQGGSFNISGDGAVAGTLSGNVVVAATQFNIGLERVLSMPGSANVFVGEETGNTSLSGVENVAVGRLAGGNLDTGSRNSFFGAGAGLATSAGTHNSFFGNLAGLVNASGLVNSFFGASAGESNIGSANSFFGATAGRFTTFGTSNTFLGHESGNANTTGSFNTAVGENADIGGSGLDNATAIGSKALVSLSNSLVLGSINGVNGATSDTNVGIGTTAPSARLHVSGAGAIRARVNSDSNAGLGLALGEQSLWSVATVSPGHFLIFNDRTVQTALTISTFDNAVNTAGALNVGGLIVANSLGSAGATTLCRNASNQVSSCSSSRRYKSDIEGFSRGLELIDRLRPVSFRWRTNGRADLGLVAEEVAEAEPLLVTRGGAGLVEGVQYDRVAVVLVNAVKEQQTQIARLTREHETLQRRLHALTAAAGKAVYEGSVTTDLKGLATVEMPEWFETSNHEFRYQLTVLGRFARAMVARKLADRRFTIQTDEPGVEVSWQITGIERDRLALGGGAPPEDTTLAAPETR